MSAIRFLRPAAAAILCAAALFAATFTAGCSRGELPLKLPPNVAEVTTVTERGELSPEFAWKGADGREMRFHEERGGVTLVNFWATWCAPCKKELPDLVELSRRYSDRGFRVVGLATDRTPNALDLVVEYVEKYSIPYQIVLSNQDLERAFGNVRQMPTSLLIGRDGRVAATLIGIRSREEFEKAIEALL